MIRVKKIVLDVLKPHNPNVLEFSRSMAEIGSDYRVTTTVMEVDEKTETIEMIIQGEHIDFESLQTKIAELGASLHSIDGVEVLSEAEKQ